MKLFHHISLLLALFFLSQCVSERNQPVELTSSFGDLSEIVVVADQSVWDGNIGDTIRSYFASAYMVLPQPEPLFDLRHFTPEQLNADPYRKQLRNYLIVANLGAQGSETKALLQEDLGLKDNTQNGTKVGKNKWAGDQTLVYIFAENADLLSKTIVAAYPGATERFHLSDIQVLEASTYQSGENKDLNDQVAKNFGLNMRIPGDYFLAMDDENTLWLRKETEFLSSNIMIHKFKYEDQKQISKEGIKTLRNDLGYFVKTQIDSTYMRINDRDLPMIVRNIPLKYPGIQARGIWEIENDYMGGPFVSYAFVKPESDTAYFIDGFIHAPGKDKRRYMQHLEHVMQSTKIF